MCTHKYTQVRRRTPRIPPCSEGGFRQSYHSEVFIWSSSARVWLSVHLSLSRLFPWVFLTPPPLLFTISFCHFLPPLPYKPTFLSPLSFLFLTPASLLTEESTWWLAWFCSIHCVSCTFSQSLPRSGGFMQGLKCHIDAAAVSSPHIRVFRSQQGHCWHTYGSQVPLMVPVRELRGPARMYYQRKGCHLDAHIWPGGQWSHAAQYLILISPE